jgi:hypothetical protein
MVRLIGSITGLLPSSAYSVVRNFVARVLLLLKGRLGAVERTPIFEENRPESCGYLAAKP